MKQLEPNNAKLKLTHMDSWDPRVSRYVYGDLIKGIPGADLGLGIEFESDDPENPRPFAAVRFRDGASREEVVETLLLLAHSIRDGKFSITKNESRIGTELNA